MNMRRVYRKIAQKYGVSVQEVKRDMQASIEYAYKKLVKTEGEKAIQKSIEYMKEVPTPQELITYAVEELKKGRRTEL